MNILIWILWGSLLAILVPAFLLGFTIILNKILLGKDPGIRTYDDWIRDDGEPPPPRVMAGLRRLMARPSPFDSPPVTFTSESSVDNEGSQPTDNPQVGEGPTVINETTERWTMEAQREQRTYDDIMEAQREKREALIEDEDRPSMLPTDGNKITLQMIDSKADLQALMDSSEIFRKKKEMGA